MKRLVPFFLLLLLCSFVLIEGDKVNLALDNYSAFFRELNAGYVDEPDPELLSRAAIDATLKSVDPYSYYISAKEQADRQKAWKGILYGGFGVNIVQRDSEITVTDVTADYPAAQNDIRPGDRILAVDNFRLRGLPFDSALKHLRGDPGSEVKLQIKRQEALLEKTLQRAEIRNRAVQCVTTLEHKIGYILFSHFLDGSADDLRNSIQQLKTKDGITSLVLDIRGNSGGLVVEAVKAANIFLRKNLNIVTLKGRQAVWNYDNLTFNDPLDTILPLVVLTDNNSISAAELFAGAIQDYDRGLIVGRKTFGKGLVQGTHHLPNGHSLYVTSARYYTPSGRCIQELDYMHKDANGKASKVPDSLRQVFHTASGRLVYNIGGIAPDIAVETKLSQNSMVERLRNAELLNDFANNYRNAHESICDAKEFRLNDEDFEQFKAWLHKSDYPFKTETEEAFDKLIAQASKAHIAASINKEQASIQKKLRQDRIAQIELNKPAICSALSKEICTRFYHNAGRIANALPADPDVLAACEVLKNQSLYRAKLRL